MDELTRKYIARINQGLNPGQDQVELSSRQYKEFKAQYLPRHLTRYERWCEWSARTIKIGPGEKDRARLEEAIGICHLETTPEGAISFSFAAALGFILLVSFLGFILPILIAAATGASDAFARGSTFMLLFALAGGLGMILPLQKLPYYFANRWRMQASNQMVLCVFYIVTYMRHTSNLELAIDFSAEHLAPPLSIDMKKVIWDLETERYGSVKESLDAYLETWKEWNPEFAESMHLIEGSLLESSETRRVEMLDKSLSVMLDETYEKMLHFAHNLKSPLTTLHMLGVILPILGLVILPLMVNFMEGVKWYHMAVIYNVTLPVLVFILAKNILSTRPTGYGNADITDLNPELKKYKDIIIPLGSDEIRLSPFAVGAIVGLTILFLAFIPILYHFASPGSDYVFTQRGEIVHATVGSETYNSARIQFLGYRHANPQDPSSPLDNGPYGMGAVLLSLLIPLGLGVGGGIYYTARSGDVMKIREQTKSLEQEFASALFQLGNRLGDGIPAEIAFSKVASVLEGTHTGRFFELVTTNITKLGMDVERAIFDPERGAILQYPSNIIESSMKVLVESNKKGPLIASRAVINVSEYIKQMHRVDERLRDLMSDVISSMKSQINFLTPVIAGIVIGITSMISSILGTIGIQLTQLQGQSGGLGGSQAIWDIFGRGSIPTYHFQAIVGLYVVQLTFILTIMINGVENGADGLSEEHSLGKNLWRSSLLYVIVSAVTIVLFGLIAGTIAQV